MFELHYNSLKSGWDFLKLFCGLSSTIKKACPAIWQNWGPVSVSDRRTLWFENELWEKYISPMKWLLNPRQPSYPFALQRLILSLFIYYATGNSSRNSNHLNRHINTSLNLPYSATISTQCQNPNETQNSSAGIQPTNRWVFQGRKGAVRSLHQDTI